MKTLLLSAMTAALMLAAPAAVAQNDRHHHGGGSGSAAPVEHRDIQRGARAQVNRSFTRTSRVRETHVNRVRESRVRVNRDVTVHNRAMRTQITNRHLRERNAVHAREFRHERQTAVDRFHRNNNRATAQRFRRENRRVVLRANFRRHNVTARHRYHFRGRFYHPPRGYRYRRWSYGERLPSIYYVRDYWIGDYYAYGLAYPPEGCVWIRYGNDAILIDEETGEILEVVYGQFY